MLSQPQLRGVELFDQPLRIRTTIEIPDETDAEGRLIKVELLATGISETSETVEAVVASARGFELSDVDFEQLYPAEHLHRVYFPSDAVNDNISAAAAKMLPHLEHFRAVGEDQLSEGVMVIDYARVEAPFRSLGLGYLLLGGLRSASTNLNLVALDPSPTLDSNDTGSEAKMKLARFWQGMPGGHFKILGDPNDDTLLLAGLWAPEPFDIETLRATGIPSAYLSPEDDI
jgi:hypothetical protein